MPALSANHSLSVNPNAIDFGTGTSNTAQVTRLLSIRNVTARPLLLRAISVEPQDVFFVRGWSGPFTLGPAKTAQLQVVFNSAKTGSYIGAVNLLVSDQVSGRTRSGSSWFLSSATVPITVRVQKTSRRKISVSISPSNVALRSGSSLQFTAQVIGGGGAVIWTAALGSINSSGMYTAPNVKSETIDNVSAVSTVDGSKYAMAAVTVSPQSTTPATSPASPTSSGPNYYVATTGDDGNDGSEAHPWATIAHADSVIGPGATVHVAPGTYLGTISLQTSGTASARIRYISDVPWGVKIVGNGGAISKVWYVGGSYVDIVGFDVSGDGNLGIWTNGTSDHILGNHVHDIQQCGSTGNGGAGIDLQNYLASDSWAIGNVIHDIGIAFAAPGTCSPGAHGIYMNHLRAVAKNNIVYRVQTYCIHEYHAPSSSIVANNLVFSCGGSSKGGGIMVADYNQNPSPVPNNHTSVINNVVINNAVMGIVENYCTPGCGPDNLYANNLLWNNGTNLKISSTGSGNIVNNLFLQPQLVNFNPNPSPPQMVNDRITFPDADYHVASGSPAIGQGTTACAVGGINPCVPTLDINGGQRSQPPDIGPFQAGATTGTWPWY